MAFRLVPQGNAILDCSPIAAAGHVIPQSYVPVSVSQFMDDLSAEEVICNRSESNNVSLLKANWPMQIKDSITDNLHVRQLRLANGKMNGRCFFF